MWIPIIIGVLVLGSGATSTSTYHNQFALYIPEGKATAQRLADKHGFVNLGEIGSLENYFLFEHPRLQRRSAEQSSDHTLMLLSEPEVEWAEQMVEKRRVKREPIPGLWDPLFSESIEQTQEETRIKRQGAGSSAFISDPMFNNQWHLNRGARGGFDMNVSLFRINIIEIRIGSGQVSRCIVCKLYGWLIHIRSNQLGIEDLPGKE